MRQAMTRSSRKLQLSAFVDGALFIVMAVCALIFGDFIFFPRIGGTKAIDTGAALTYIFGPSAILSILVANKRYHLWRDRLFGGILIICWLVLSVRAATPPPWGGIGALGAIVFGPFFAVPLWQIVRLVTLLTKREPEKT
jgi:hypothetical protein